MNKFPIAVSVCSTSCDRYLYLFHITDFDDLVKQITEHCFEFKTGDIDSFKLECNGVLDTKGWCSKLHDICEENYERNN